MAFYDDMAAMARDLLKPDAQGGLGQGVIAVRREEPGTVNPDKPWEPVEPTITEKELRGAARGIGSELVGTEAGGTVLLSTDLVVTTEVPSIELKAGDVLLVDGLPTRILSIEFIPAAGTPAAAKFIVRG